MHSSNSESAFETSEKNTANLQKCEHEKLSPRKFASREKQSYVFESLKAIEKMNAKAEKQKPKIKMCNARAEEQKPRK